MKSNTQKQAEYRARMREEGYYFIQCWIPEKQKDKALNYLKKLKLDHLAKNV